ncbi:MAG: acetyl-CoA carboxylase biotin carboxyl carrier protein subunit [Deltaproteobacteria bacterium]|nr:acetyl-CoA carboxylase biotin carboxyl carrier protein subunit [Deltaproteobacteria bacterium]
MPRFILQHGEDRYEAEVQWLKGEQCDVILRSENQRKKISNVKLDKKDAEGGFIAHLGSHLLRGLVKKRGDDLWIWTPQQTLHLRLTRPHVHLASIESPAENLIRAPMTGKIVKIAVKEGEAVGRGEVIVIFEAMKMEYPLTASHEGHVEKILTKVGEQVDLGKILVEMTAPKKRESRLKKSRRK